MDLLQWMGAVRMRVQTADKNITIIHTAPFHLVKWNGVFVRNKTIIKMVESDLLKKQTHLHLGWPEGTFSAIFHFWVNYFFKYVSVEATNLETKKYLIFCFKSKYIILISELVGLICGVELLIEEYYEIPIEKVNRENTPAIKSTKMGTQWTATYTQQFYPGMSSAHHFIAIQSNLLKTFTHLFSQTRDPYLHKWGSDTIEPWLAHPSTAR